MAAYLMVGAFNNKPSIHPTDILRYLRFSEACAEREINGALEIYEEITTTVAKLTLYLIKLDDPDIHSTDLTLLLLKPISGLKLNDEKYVEAKQEQVLKVFLEQTQELRINTLKDFPAAAKSKGDIAWTIRDVSSVIEYQINSKNSRFKRIQ